MIRTNTENLKFLSFQLEVVDREYVKEKKLAAKEFEVRLLIMEWQKKYAGRTTTGMFSYCV